MDLDNKGKSQRIIELQTAVEREKKLRRESQEQLKTIVIDHQMQACRLQEAREACGRSQEDLLRIRKSMKAIMSLLENAEDLNCCICLGTFDIEGNYISERCSQCRAVMHSRCMAPLCRPVRCPVCRSNFAYIERCDEHSEYMRLLFGTDSDSD